MTALTYPPAKQRIIPAGSNDPVIVPVLASIHVAVSMVRSLFNFFNGPSGGIESHLYLLRDGTWEQYRQFNREADAQLGGNSWVSGGTRFGSVTIECQGWGSGYLSEAQKAELKAFALWARDNLGIPLRKLTEPNPTSLAAGGWGYHSLFKAWNSMGKTCPGRNRIAWFHSVMVPWMLLESIPKRLFYTVRAGDTIDHVAAAHDLSTSDLWRLNHGTLHVGDQVRIR